MNMMDVVRIILKSPRVTAVLGFIAGLFVGLFVLGWWLWPVKWTDASPAALQKDYRAEYLRMAIESFLKTGDIQVAQARWSYLGSKASDTLKNVKSEPRKLTTDEISVFENAIKVKPGTAETTKKGGGISPILIVIVLLCLVTLAIGAALAYILLFRGGKRTGVITPAMEAQEARQMAQAQVTDYAALGETPPIAQFMASYKLGDDLFDDSFSIDSPSGEFLGECGVGISETIGVGDPKKVAAFEVWLFDKNDIQTVTKVMMSTHAFNDEATRQRLAAKGEPVLAKNGEMAMLETATLRLMARVVDMTYGEGALPPESFFDQAILELAIWQK
jgi:hypothetical protein